MSACESRGQGQGVLLFVVPHTHHWDQAANQGCSQVLHVVHLRRRSTCYTLEGEGVSLAWYVFE